MPGQLYYLIKKEADSWVDRARRMSEDTKLAQQIVSTEQSMRESSLGEEFFLSIYRNMTPARWSNSRKPINPVSNAYHLASSIKKLESFMEEYADSLKPISCGIITNA